MNDLFADTSGWGNYLDASQPFNTLAVRLVSQAPASGRRLVTTNYGLADRAKAG
jgi:hypothetical protein